MYFMCEEKKKAYEFIERLNEDALKVLNGLMSAAVQCEQNRADLPQEKLREIRKERKRQEAKEKKQAKKQARRELVRVRTCEETFKKLEAETLQGDSMDRETLDFMCMNLEAIRTFLLWHPNKFYNVVEVIHTHGLNAGRKEKSHQPHDQARQATF